MTADEITPDSPLVSVRSLIVNQLQIGRMGKRTITTGLESSIITQAVKEQFNSLDNLTQIK